MWRLPLLVACLACLCFPVQAAPTIVPSDGFNLIISKSTDTDLTVAPQVKGFAHNWFAGRFAGLSREQETTIRVDMNEQDTVGNKASVGKWNGLRPVFTYADPNRYESYIAFERRAQGVWVSSDPFLQGAARLAGNGATPKQNMIPPALAAGFLSADGASWFPWQEIETAAPGKNNTFVIRHTFALPWASVAMRVPFTYSFFSQFVARLKAANLPVVKHC